MGFEGMGTATEFRDVMRKMVQEEVRKLRPAYKYGTVESVDEAALKAMVILNGDTASVPVNFGLAHPNVGDIVRVEGIGTDKFITDIVAASRVVGNAKRLAQKSTFLGDSSSVSGATPPSFFPTGTTVSYTSIDTGFPRNYGTVVTEKAPLGDVRAVQTFTTKVDSEVWRRTATDSNNWGAWVRMGELHPSYTVCRNSSQSIPVTTWTTIVWNGATAYTQGDEKGNSADVPYLTISSGIFNAVRAGLYQVEIKAGIGSLNASTAWGALRLIRGTGTANPVVDSSTGTIGEDRHVGGVSPSHFGFTRTFHLNVNQKFLVGVYGSVACTIAGPSDFVQSYCTVRYLGAVA